MFYVRIHLAPVLALFWDYFGITLVSRSNIANYLSAKGCCIPMFCYDVILLEVLLSVVAPAVCGGADLDTVLESGG